MRLSQNRDKSLFIVEMMKIYLISYKRASHELKILFLDILILINLSFNLVLSIDILIKLFSVYFNI